MDYRQLLKQLNVDEEAVMEFFVAFSRFEFALKQAGYLKSGKDGRKAEPDWHAFATKYEDKFDPEKEPQLREAWDYLDEEPPKTQVVVHGKLDFELDKRLAGKSPFDKATQAIKTVRNNLFHGGKFPISGVVDDPARKTKLLNECTILLEEMLELAPDVKTEFYPTLKSQ